MAARTASGGSIADVPRRSHAARSTRDHVPRATQTGCSSRATSCRWNTLRARQRARRRHGDVATTAAAPPLSRRISRQPIPGWRIEKITRDAARIAEADPQGFRARAGARRARSGARSTRIPRISTRRSRTGSLAPAALPITAEQLAALPVPDHLRVNIRVVDLDGSTLARRPRSACAQAQRATSRTQSVRADGRDTVHRRWDFGELPAQQVVQRRGLRFTVYPTLRDHGDGVELTEAGSAADARRLAAPGSPAAGDARSARAVQVRAQAIRRRPRHRAARSGTQHVATHGRIAGRACVRRLFSRRGQRRCRARPSSSRRCSTVTAATSATSSIAC